MPGTYYSQLFRSAVWLLKYFLLAVFGLSIALALTGVVGASTFAEMIFWTLGPLILRAAMFVGCFMGVVIVVESLRQ